jgi:hypothetical protein
MPLSRRRFFVFATITSVVPVVLMTMAVLAADLYLHKRAERSAGLNRWGYRGPVVSRKQRGEVRIAVLGGSTAFGYGLRWDQAPPAILERELNARFGDAPRVSVVNLGFNNEGVYSYRYTLDDFAFLDYDVAYLFDGYNDLMGDGNQNRSLFRHESAVFRLTGYYPILPLVLNEKAMSIRTGGNLGQAYAAARNEPAGKTTFTPGLAGRTSAAALESAAAISNSLGRQIGRLSPAPAPSAPSSTEAGCSAPWSLYCQSMHGAAKHAIDNGKAVVIVLQPRLIDGAETVHREQQQALSAMIERRFRSAPLATVDLSAAVDLHDRANTFDGMHLSSIGVERAMAMLAERSAAFVRTASAAQH